MESVRASILRDRHHGGLTKGTGDLLAHYGLEARLAFVQMLINHLVERDRQERWNMPWLPQLKGNDSSSEIPTASDDEVLAKHSCLRRHQNKFLFLPKRRRHMMMP